MEPTLLQKQVHAGTVTMIERVWWKGGITAWIAGDFPLADQFVLQGGEAEHFYADLSPIPELVTADEGAEAQIRISRLQDLVRVLATRGYGMATVIASELDDQLRQVMGR